ncbi:GEM-like protein 4 [Prosopis cineraria]|uniref:GEM-like protein 4 n=1 Tax=Prosopis cineraria TaxID=364024 RepID=UPI002410264F|nr:GEM-like protein 4 [Prosopis cineraria]XP_054808778.1 GEM-like protein 4 [Prosopis cineraria]
MLFLSERKSDTKRKASLLQQLVIGIPIISKRYLPHSAGQNKFNKNSNQSKASSVLGRMNKFGKNADSFAHEVREHVRLGPKITDTVKGKLRLGARILQVGGVEKIFLQLFSVKEGEKLLKASQCYLSTTSGPIAGLLFISTEKVAFCSDRSIKITSSEGEVIGGVHYKVLIPLFKIRSVNQSKNVKKPSQKYIEIITLDNFEFWFMGFLNYQKTFKYLQHALSQS